jgi:proteasome lid subunit RPN8/RPN11
LDAAFATHTIHNWAGAGICAIGFVHSHLVDKDDLSRADRESASSLLQALQLPLLYIGVMVINKLENIERTRLVLHKAVLDENQRCIFIQLPYVITGGSEKLEEKRNGYHAIS